MLISQAQAEVRDACESWEESKFLNAAVDLK